MHQKEHTEEHFCETLVKLIMKNTVNKGDFFDNVNLTKSGSNTRADNRDMVFRGYLTHVFKKNVLHFCMNTEEMGSSTQVLAIQVQQVLHLDLYLLFC